jgi:hypothetical protein
MTEMRLAPIARGVLSYLPALNNALPAKSVGQTGSSRYCYSLWMRHLTLLHAHGLDYTPHTLAELGPGETLGVGLSALLSGSDRYIGLDVVPHSNATANQQVLRKLLPLFQDRASARLKGWPDFSEHLDGRGFPSGILTQDVLDESLAAERVTAIRDALAATQAGPIRIEYKAPWSDPRVVDENSVDLVISASVLEHVVDLPATYRALYRWLKPGGWMSHQIDLKSHGLTRSWNGFRACSEGVWNLAFGRRPYMINRHPASDHLRLMLEAGFELTGHYRLQRSDGIRREELSPRWSAISDEDLATAALYVVATKR